MPAHHPPADRQALRATDPDRLALIRTLFAGDGFPWRAEKDKRWAGRVGES